MKIANRMMLPTRLTLGTAQLGMDYGISNILGQPSKTTAFQILDAAFESGIRFLDTARSYGNSESTIGSWLHDRKRSISIITKIPRLEKGLKSSSIEKRIRRSLDESLTNLRCNQIWGAMFHSYDTLGKYHSTAVSTLLRLRKEGIVDHVGVSVYSPEELVESLNFEFDIFQAPINCLDARWNDQKLLDSIKHKILFARSIYLQGLLLLEPKAAEQKVPGSGIYIAQLESIAKRLKMDRKTTAFSFINSQKQISSLVVGIETVKQVKEDVKLSKTAFVNKEQIEQIRKEIGQVPINILNPTLWPKERK